MSKKNLSRREFISSVGGLGLLATLGAPSVIDVPLAWGQGTPPGAPLPSEKVEETMKRLFGNRPITPGEGKVKLEAPLIAENGSVVPVTVDADVPMTPAKFAKNIYVIADKNRRPLNAKFSLTPESAKASIATNIRLADTTNLRAVVEMNDGTLYMVKQEVKVTVGGCGG
jgi:sulfur-oxidizing protein SoxY